MRSAHAYKSHNTSEHTQNQYGRTSYQQSSEDPRLYRHDSGRSAASARTASVSSRRRKGKALQISRGTMLECGLVFALVMVYIFLHAAALATAFRSRQLDDEISEAQSSMHRDFSRIAVITSPDIARHIAETRGFQKVTPDRIDDLTVFRAERVATRPVSGATANKPVRIVLAPSPATP